MRQPAETGTGRALVRVLREVPALRKGMTLTLGLGVVGTALAVVVPILVQQMVDNEILGSGAIDGGGVVRRGSLAVAAILLAAVANRIALVRLIAASATGLSDLRVRTFRHLHSLSALHLQAERRGALVARVTSDVAAIQDFMDWAGVAMVVGTVQVVLAVTAMAIYSWQLALVVIAGVAVYAILLSWFQRILARAHDRVRVRVADSLAAISEAISGLPVIRAYGAEPATRRKVDEKLDAQFRAEYATGKLGAFLFSSAEVFAGTLTALVVLVGVLLGAGSGTSAGTLLAFLFLVNLLIDPVQMLVETLDHAQTAGAGLRRVLSVLDSPPDVVDPVGGTELPEGALGVTFEEVSFAYPDGTQALSGVRAVIAPERRVAVVGETGSGKTTFAKLAARLMDPSSGRVLIGAVDARQISFASLRRRVAFVPQEGFLFDSTIADNVRYGRPGATDQEIVGAFAALDLTEWIESLDRGIDTRVGERGGHLSSGERQLVALVRAMISGPAVLILDEATSAVDPALEVQLRHAIERAMLGRTSITIAHRLSTAEASDEILVFDRGRLVERGTHPALVARDGVYAGLHADWSAGTGVMP